jgi:hypothetical protein
MIKDGPFSVFVRNQSSKGWVWIVAVMVMMVLTSLTASTAVQGATFSLSAFELSGNDDNCMGTVQGVGSVTEGSRTFSGVQPGTYKATAKVSKSRSGPNGGCVITVSGQARILSGPGSHLGFIGMGFDEPCCKPPHSVTGQIKVLPPKLIITLPSKGDKSTFKKNFLVKTRQSGSIVGGANEIVVSTKIKPEPDNFTGDITWSFGGDVNNEDVTTQPRQPRMVSLTAQRQESGRGQSPMRARITAKATFGTVQVTDQVIIEQIKGKPAYNVIRQEYEDVTSDVGSSGRDDAITLPSSGVFQLGTTNFPYALGTSIVPSLPNPNDNYD